MPPLPIEEAIQAIPGTSDAAIMSIESAYQVARLIVAVESDPPAANLVAAVGEILSGCVRTFEIALLPRFPRTQTGKVRRQEIKAAYYRDRVRAGTLHEHDRAEYPPGADDEPGKR